MIRTAALLAAFLLPFQALALELPGGAARALEDFAVLSSYKVPTSAWSDGTFDAIDAEGRIIREAWHIPGDASTLQLLAPLRTQLTDDGYELIFECETEYCGGFDFRFETEVIPEPEMHVDLGDFRFLAAQREGEAGVDYITLMVSRSSNTGYIQFVKVTPASVALEEEANLATKSPDGLGITAPSLALATSGIAGSLEQSGRAILPDLSFETGSSRLQETEFASLEELATYLRANPSRKVTLVGHTDASGSLDANIALSRSRARAVLKRLQDAHNIPASQLAADGVGYLMPLASNLTDEGRATNRRVEAVLTSTE